MKRRWIGVILMVAGCAPEGALDAVNYPGPRRLGTRERLNTLDIQPGEKATLAVATHPGRSEIGFGRWRENGSDMEVTIDDAAPMGLSSPTVPKDGLQKSLVFDPPKDARKCRVYATVVAIPRTGQPSKQTLAGHDFALERFPSAGWERRIEFAYYDADWRPLTPRAKRLW